MAAPDSSTGGIWINRTPTYLSLQQLEDSCPPRETACSTLSCEPQPDAAVADSRGACIAQYRYPALDAKPRHHYKRVRSFGDLNNVVPDLYAGPDDSRYSTCRPNQPQ